MSINNPDNCNLVFKHAVKYLYKQIFNVIVLLETTFTDSLNLLFSLKKNCASALNFSSHIARFLLLN